MAPFLLALSTPRLISGPSCGLSDLRATTGAKVRVRSQFGTAFGTELCCHKILFLSVISVSLPDTFHYKGVRPSPRHSNENENGFCGHYPPKPPVCDAIYKENGKQITQIAQIFIVLYKEI